MSITLSEISYSEIALYCLYFFLMLLGAVIFLIFYKLIANVLEKVIIKTVKLKYVGGSLDINLKTTRRASKVIRVIKMIFNWLEIIIGISLILLFFLMLIKLLISNETFAYTIVTLLIFVLSSQIAGFIRSTWTTDKYVFSKVIDIGEIIKINDVEGVIDSIGINFFCIKIKKEGYIEKVRFPISDLNFRKVSKIKRIYGKEKIIKKL